MKNKGDADIELANNSIGLCKERVDQCDPSPVVLEKIKNVYEPKLEEIYKKISAERSLTDTVVKRIY